MTVSNSDINRDHWGKERNTNTILTSSGSKRSNQAQKKALCPSANRSFVLFRFANVQDTLCAVSHSINARCASKSVVKALAEWKTLLEWS